MVERRVRHAVQRKVPQDNAPGFLASLDPVLRRLYAARGIRDAAQLDYALLNLAPVSTLAGIDNAVNLLLQHRGKRIVVVGDFDADGATSTALVIRCLRDFGFGSVDYLVPNRFRFGYGLTPEIVGVAAGRSPDLLITVDNGISSMDGVAEAHRLGIKVLITDHHLPGAELPDADAMVNPNSPGNNFASPHLAGVGVAFYLMAATGRALEASGQAAAARVPAKYLDLVALGTVADVVRLDYNNRILVRQGLERIRAGQCVAGIAALFQVASRSVRRAVSTDLGFVAGPRLNAAGRLEDMSIGIECLLTDDVDQALSIASTLDQINRERKDIEETMRREAFAYVDAMDANNLPACVCLYDPAWHQGIVGLIAARVRERCDRPAIAFAADGSGQLKGSARSIPGIHVRDLLESVASAHPQLIGKYGGHAMAAGLNLHEENLAEFSRRVAQKLLQLYPEADFSGAIMTDGDLPPHSLNLEFARCLRDAGPWGAGFPEPVFCGHFTVDDQRTVGENHLKLRVRPAGGGGSIDAIAFNQAGPAIRGVVNLIYRLDVNEFRGVESAQLVVEQIGVVAAAPG
jgi:single-stranded-DNA-specific exonuclease